MSASILKLPVSAVYDENSDSWLILDGADEYVIGAHDKDLIARIVAALNQQAEQATQEAQLLAEAQSLLQEMWDRGHLFRGTRILKWVTGKDADEQREEPQDAYRDFSLPPPPTTESATSGNAAQEKGELA